LRKGACDLETKGAKASIKIDLDGSGRANISCGSGFLDHMIGAFCKTGQMDLEVRATGGSHHRAMAVGRAIGLAINDALGDRSGIQRYGSAYLPMDESLAAVALDLSGRPYLVLLGVFSGERIGDLEVQEIETFMEALTDGARLTLHIKFYGENDHHKAESIFKALGSAIREAVKIDGKGVPSTKGVI
jgi:imidazoleglycerol phosphate dehydratase HisB